MMVAPWVLTSQYVRFDTSHRPPESTAAPGRWSSTGVAPSSNNV